jgi:two-component system, LytTR family, sensor histidine kinase AlgZ
MYHRMSSLQVVMPVQRKTDEMIMQFINPPSPVYSKSKRTDRSIGNILTAILSWSFAGAVLALLFEAVFHAERSPAQVAREFIDSFVYATFVCSLIGSLIFIFTPRLVQIPFPFNWIAVISLLLLLTFIGSLMAGFSLMGLGIFPGGNYSWIGLRRMGLGFLLSLVIGVSGYLYETVRLRLKLTIDRLRAKEMDEELAQKLAVEASLSSLESRIRPHFLFNTLNSISGLIQEDPVRAERMVEQLAALLRFSLDSSHRRTIALERELKIAVDYLEIEKARFGERLKYCVDVEDGLGDVQVPPFVIQTLVENSVKHALSTKREGGHIHVKAEATRDRVSIEVEDDGPGFDEEAMTDGHGLQNLRSRLSTLFENDGVLSTSKRDKSTIVSVSLPNRQVSR